jgi:hypothetical protein
MAEMLETLHQKALSGIYLQQRVQLVQTELLVQTEQTVPMVPMALDLTGEELGRAMSLLDTL